MNAETTKHEPVENLRILIADDHDTVRAGLRLHCKSPESGAKSACCC